MLACLTIGIALSALVLARSLTANDGYLSPDSTHYLALATNLGVGRGFLIAGDGRFPAEYRPFAEWPVGYSLLIHLLSAATGLSVFIASKLVNAAALMFAVALIGLICGRTGPVLALSFGFASYLDIFTFSWSEGPFIGLLILAATLLARLAGHSKGRLMVARELALGITCLALFLLRYVGAFSLSIMGLALLAALYRRDYRAVILYADLLVVVASLIALYLRNNTHITGYATGMPRTAPGDAAVDRFFMLAAAMWSEAVLRSPCSIHATVTIGHWPFGKSWAWPFSGNWYGGDTPAPSKRCAPMRSRSPSSWWACSISRR